MPSERALRFLSSRELVGVKFGLENIRTLARLVGHPERATPVVLVAGTNGKGSTVALLESILRAAGAKTGRFTSPHLESVTERICINGAPIDRQALLEVVDYIAGVAEKALFDGELDAEPTFFETLTASAWLSFESAGVDVAIFEVGLGGRLDATSIAPARMSVITRVGLDHQKILGAHLEQIASEKAAIIKSGRPVVVGPQAQAAYRVIARQSRRRRAPLHDITSQLEVQYQLLARGSRLRVRTPDAYYDDLHLPLAGLHQVDNLATAVRAAEVLAGELAVNGPSAVSLSQRAVRRGVATVCWPGRLEHFAPRGPDAPELLLDAAHNVLAVDSLASYLGRSAAQRRVIVLGVMADKDYIEMTRRLLPHCDHLILTRPPSRRALEPGVLSSKIGSLLDGAGGIRLSKSCVEVVCEPMRALDRAMQLACAEDQVVVCGSIYLLGAIRPLLIEREAEASEAPNPAVHVV